ncbi:MAG: MATE family efflux transporter [Hyphomicrobiaceae bacterium]|nr:MATE family efflux transporter [Hyphomicrobiaceae bacterium]
MGNSATVSGRGPRLISERWRAELLALFRLAAPIVATQFAWVAMLITDTAMIGHLGPKPLAGATLSLMVFYLGYVFCFGVTMATAALAAQAYGARKPRNVRRVIRQGLWVTIILVTPCLILFSQVTPLLGALGQPQELFGYAEAYMTTLKWCLLPGIAFSVLRNFVSALGRPAPAFWVMLAGVPINAALDYGLIFGNFGLPRLGVTGAGVATTTVNIVMFLSLAAIALRRRPFAKYEIFARFWRPDWTYFRQIFLIGLPIAGISLMEAGFFIAAVFVMGWIGPIAIAAHMIAIQLPHLTFMMPMGLAQAATVRVGQAVGRRDVAGAYHSGWVAFVVTLAVMAVMTIVILTIPELFASLFLDASRPDTAAVLPLAISLLFLAAFFQLADGLQAVAAGALRGLNDTAIPMVIAGVSYWGVGAGSGLWFAFEQNMGARGIWVGFIVGLTCASLVLVWRFAHQWRRGYLPPPVRSHDDPAHKA